MGIRSGRQRFLFGGVAALVCGLLAWDWGSGLPPDAMVGARYVGRQSCSQCHQAETDSWTGSHHDRAMELASPSSVLGDFNDAVFTRLGQTTRFFRRDGKYFVNTEGPDGQLHDYEVKYTFGVEPLQQYMVKFPDGRVQVLRVSWDTAAQKWFYVPPPDAIEERLEPGDPLHWTGLAQNWNTTCAECHSTNLQKNYDLKTDTYRTSFSEIDVSCEACHGPGSVHLELANRRSLFWDRRHGYGLARLKSTDTSVQIETCATCHSRRSRIHPDFRPGRPFLDDYEPSLLLAGLYHNDGQILDEVYVYGSFLESKMHAKGVRCTDCHDPHSLELRFPGNRLCAQCHQPGKYDSPSHHHHQPESPGSQCVACHMPERTYMVVDPRRDHSLRIPRPDLSVELGTPNACNDCHVGEGETPQWAAAAVREWYGERPPENPHWAPAFAAANAALPDGEDLLVDLVERNQTPDIVRATAVMLLGQYHGVASRQAREQALEDRHPWVRLSAARVAPASTPDQLVRQLAPLLNDNSESVRAAAGLQFANLPPQQPLTSQQQRAFDAALDEYRARQTEALDRAAGHLNLGTLATRLQQPGRAAKSFRQAIRLEPYLTGPRSQLAAILEQQGADADQVRELRQQELDLLRRDVSLLPDNPGVTYRLGLMHYLLGNLASAESALQRAAEQAPQVAEYQLALALIAERRYEQGGALSHFNTAVAALKQMEAIDSQDVRARQVLQRMLGTRRHREDNR